jgi:FkbM family methyltransferase
MFKEVAFSSLILAASLCAETSPYVFQFEGLFQSLYQSGRYDLIERIIEPDDVILEAGAFDGTDTIGLSKMVPEGRVISFEPNPPRYAELVNRAKDLYNVNTFPFALGEENSNITFYVCYGEQYDPVYEGASSALPPSESMKINYQGPRIEVPCVILDHWCRQNNQTKIDFMWLDMEGYELQVLKSSPQILSTVKAMYVETNFYEFRKGMTQYNDLRTFLEKNGFRLLSHGYLTGCQGNAIFVRADIFEIIVQKISSDCKIKGY